MVECQLPKLKVASSILVARSNYLLIGIQIKLFYDRQLERRRFHLIRLD